MSRYPELAAKVDAFFARVMGRHPDQMACGAGCSECCHVRLSVTGVEADAIRTHVAGMTPEARAALAANVAAAPAKQCAALAPDGKCMVYEGRPIVCRSHGAPIKLRPTSPSKLKVYSTCRYNFANPMARNADPDCVYDQETTSMLLGAVNRDAGFDDTRYDIAELLHAILND